MSIYACKDFEAVKAALGKAKQELGEILSGIFITCLSQLLLFMLLF